MANAFSGNSSTTSGMLNFSNPPLNELLNQITTIKLDRGNFLLWKNRALPILRSYKLEIYLLGLKECPSMFLDQNSTTLKAILVEAGVTAAGASAARASSSQTVVSSA